MTGIRNAAAWAGLGVISVLLAFASLAGAWPFTGLF
jgi:hypothetical protein